MENVKTELFPAQNFLYDYLKTSLFNKIKHRLGEKKIYNSINQELKEKIEEFQPDILWVFKGMEVLPSTLHFAKHQKVKLVNYNPDNPFIFTGRGSGNQNVKDSIKLFDFYITYSTEIFEQLKKEIGKEKSYLLPFGYELPEELDLKELPEEILRVCFIGNPDKERAKFIREMLSAGIKIDLFGHHWNKYLAHPNVSIMEAAYGMAFWEKLRSYRVQLNLLRIHNLTSHNMRTFEIPGAGGIQLAPKTKDHSSFFKEGNEIFLFNSVSGAIEKVKLLLQLEGKEARKIRTKAMNKCLNGGYSYQNKAEEILSVFTLII